MPLAVGCHGEPIDTVPITTSSPTAVNVCGTVNLPEPMTGPLYPELSLGGMMVLSGLDISGSAWKRQCLRDPRKVTFRIRLDVPGIVQIVAGARSSKGAEWVAGYASMDGGWGSQMIPLLGEMTLEFNAQERGSNTARDASPPVSADTRRALLHFIEKAGAGNEAFRRRTVSVRERCESLDERRCMTEVVWLIDGLGQAAKVKSRHYGAVACTSAPPGLEVLIDKFPTGRITPVPENDAIYLSLGRHKLELRDADFRSRGAQEFEVTDAHAKTPLLLDVLER